MLKRVRLLPISTRGLLLFVPFIVGAAFAQQGNPIDYAEASAFERSLLSKNVSPLQHSEKQFTQPVNQKVPCKLPTSSDQLARRNFRSYWDGECKDGFAHGLGRDIAISDTHHVEEITVHNGTGEGYKGLPSVGYDFVNNTVNYRVGGEKYPESSFFSESIQSSMERFLVVYRAGREDALGNVLYTEFSPFGPVRYFMYKANALVYRFMENTVPATGALTDAIFVADTLDATTGTVGGVAVVRFGSAQVQHFKINGNQRTPVVLPPEYVAHLNEKLSSVDLAAKGANVDSARQMEREYLYMACNGKYAIDGLSKDVSSKICSWRDQFKAPYAEAVAKSKLDLAQLKQKVEAAEQHRQKQQLVAQQIAGQQAAAEQSAAQYSAAQEALNRRQSQQDAVNALEQIGQQMQNAGNQMLQNVQRQPAPQIGSWGRNSGRVNCVTVGTITSCR